MTIYGQKAVYNIATGQTELVDLTPEEVAQRDNERAAAVADAIRVKQHQQPIDVPAQQVTRNATLKSFWGDVTASGSEAPLYVYVVPSDTLTQDGDCIMARYSVVFANNATLKDLRVYWGNTLIADASGLNTAAADSAADVDLMIVRSGPASVRTSVKVAISGVSSTVKATQKDISLSVLANPQMLKLTGAGGVTAKSGIIQFLGVN